MESAVRVGRKIGKAQGEALFIDSPGDSGNSQQRGGVGGECEEASALMKIEGALTYAVTCQQQVLSGGVPGRQREVAEQVFRCLLAPTDKGLESECAVGPGLGRRWQVQRLDQFGSADQITVEYQDEGVFGVTSRLLIVTIFRCADAQAVSQ